MSSDTVWRPAGGGYPKTVHCRGDCPRLRQSVTVNGKQPIERPADVFPEWINRCEICHETLCVDPLMGDHLAACRGLAGLSVGELGECVGVSEQTTSRWERGERTPRVTHDAALRELFDDLGVDVAAAADIPLDPLSGEALRRRRTKAGLTQADLADRIGVAQQAVSYWEREDVTPERGALARLQCALVPEVSTDDQ